MTDLPERFWAWLDMPNDPDESEWWEFEGEWTADGREPKIGTECLRTDIAITRAEADAMVREAVAKERERCAILMEESDCPTRTYLAAAIREEPTP